MATFFSRDQLLGGLPARRASTLLFAIESRTAQLARRARQVGARYLTEQSAAEQEGAFLAALSQGRAAAALVTIQELVRYAPLWAPLVPDDPGLRAALAQFLAGKYRFRYGDVPAVRVAVGLDDPSVQAAYQRLNNQPLSHIFQATLSPRERFAWGWTGLAYRLEDLPPFWTAFSLTLTETVGGGILALPIAFAALGALGGILVLVALGVVNLLTIGGLSEAIVHNGHMRYGTSYFGRLVGDYFGAPGVLALTLALTLAQILTLLVYYIGTATTLQAATHLPGVLWMALLFLVHLYFLRRESIEATAASALVIGALNIALLLVLMLLAVHHLRPEYLQRLAVPGLGGQPFTPVILSAVFGVGLGAFLGHTSAVGAARVVLRRDPSGRMLIWGNITALGVAGVLYALWVLVVNGSLSPIRLAAETGTALAPLAETAGPLVYVFGTLFALLAMGMASIQVSLGLYFSVREKLPARPAAAAQTAAPASNAGRPAFLSRTRARFLVSISPVVLIFLAGEWLLWAKLESFTSLMGFLGALVVPVLAGIFPILLLVASRRQADYAASGAPAWWGHPLVAGGAYLVFVATLLIHALVLFQNPVQRLLALSAALGVIGLTVVLVRRGAFRPRQVVEIRLDSQPAEHASFNIVANGRPSLAQVILDYGGEQTTVAAASGALPKFRALQSAQFQLESAGVRELKLWVHAVTPEGDSQALPARAYITGSQAPQTFDLGAQQGQVIVPTAGAPVTIRLELLQSPADAQGRAPK